MDIETRPISWVKAALKEFRNFPEGAQARFFTALDIAAEGEKSDIVKPMKGLGSGVFEIALKYQTDAYRVVYAVQIDDRIWVVHAFKKKSKTGIKTPKQEIDQIKERIEKLKEMFK